MDIKIMSIEDALKYNPSEPTYAIRIFSSFGIKDMLYPLKDSPFYLRIARYVFDDNKLYFKCGPLSLDNSLARTILEDFREHKKNVECLLVHCMLGKNRSPAVAFALNEVFKLGKEDSWFRENYPYFNKLVHKTILDAAKEFGFSD